MAHFKEYENYDGLGLAELVKKKKVTPQELMAEAMKRIEERNPKLNAVICTAPEKAREDLDAGLPRGPFHGVPFLLKDLLAAWKGVPLTNGSRAYRNYIPDFDSELVSRFKKAGLLILGKTSTPEFGLMGITEPELFGPARNPWNIDHTPGGSSGGTGSAVAAGIVPLASGGDGGGSIRIPAGYCGLFGLKPTRGRNPVGPAAGELWQGAVVEHVLTRSVRDSAAVLDATCGMDRGARTLLPQPEKPYLKEIKAKTGQLKVAFSTESPVGMQVHPDCIAAVEDAARLLEDLGHIVEEKTPPLDGKALAMSYITMYYGEVAADIDATEEVLGRKPSKKDFELSTWTLGLLGKVFSARDFVSAIRLWDQAAGVMGEFHEEYDLYLTPTAAMPPARIGELLPTGTEKFFMNLIDTLKMGKLLKATGMTEQIALESLERTPFTQLANFTGQPAMSVPLYWTDEGFPLGVQFIAPFGDEALLFRLAGQLEKARPWFGRRPEL